jgi:XTP/dITP diphosphohydrolase
MRFPLVLATGNPDKAREICEVLTDAWDHALAAWALEVQQRGVGFLLDTPEGIADAVADLAAPAAPPDTEETGDTLEANARIKAVALCDAYDLVAVADDTGLEVDALGGAPGVRSARYAGDDANANANIDRLLRELDGIPAADRTARFITVALARFVDGREIVASGCVEGAITTERHGSGGFGYDPVFQPREGDGRTFAEMTADEKHELSHRGRAFRALATALNGSNGG